MQQKKALWLKGLLFPLAGHLKTSRLKSLLWETSEWEEEEEVYLVTPLGTTEVVPRQALSKTGAFIEWITIHFSVDFEWLDKQRHVRCDVSIRINKLASLSPMLQNEGRHRARASDSGESLLFHMLILENNQTAARGRSKGADRSRRPKDSQCLVTGAASMIEDCQSRATNKKRALKDSVSLRVEPSMFLRRWWNSSIWKARLDYYHPSLTMKWKRKEKP